MALWAIAISLFTPRRRESLSSASTSWFGFQVGDVHTSPFAGLGHRLITWLPTRQSRFDSGSPHHICTLRLSAGYLFFKQKRRVQFSQGAPFWAGSFSGMTARFERAYEGSIPSSATNRSASRRGVAAHNGKQDGSKPLRATIYFRPRLSARTPVCGAGKHGAAPWVGTSFRSEAQVDERWSPKPEAPGSRPGSPAIF